jgi:hypothetical protein
VLRTVIAIGCDKVEEELVIPASQGLQPYDQRV